MKKQFLVTSLLLGFVTVGIGLIQITHYFSIKQINCTVNQSQPCPAVVQAELNKDLGKSVFYLDVNARVNRIVSFLPSLHQFQYREELPNTVQVNFISAQPKYLVQRDPDTAIFAVDETGTLIDQPVPTALPLIHIGNSLSSAFSSRNVVNPELHRAILSMLNEIDKHHLQPSTISILDQQNLSITMPNQIIVQLSLSNPAQQIDKLAYLVANFNFNTLKNPVKTIDLRFRYPILKT